MNPSVVDTRWARKKLDRARSLVGELNRATSGWVHPAQHKLQVEIREQGRRIEARLDNPYEPPMDDWALIVGDCVHNIRTALDVFVWANSEHSDAKFHQWAYPIQFMPPEEDYDVDDTDPPSKFWSGALEKVKGVPDPLKTLIMENTRWAHAVDGAHYYQHDALPLVQELDNIDKHRLALDLESSQAMTRWAVTAFDSRDRPIDVELDWSGTHGRDDRNILIVGYPMRPAARVTGEASVSFELRVSVRDRSLALPGLLSSLIVEVADTLTAFSYEVDRHGRGLAAPCSRLSQHSDE